MRSFFSITLLLLAFLVAAAGAKKSKPPVKPVGLIPDYYKVTGTCKQAEKLVKQVVQEKVRNDSTLGAKLLRVHYHDCFVKVSTLFFFNLVFILQLFHICMH